VAAVGGILLVWQTSQVAPFSGGVAAVIDILIIAVVGGIRRPIGAFVGAFIFVLLSTFSPDVLSAFGLSNERFKLVIGVGFLAVVFFSPDGALGLWERWRERRRRAVDPLTGREAAGRAP
jgi:branched-chain amino acid transport system permease protein